MPGSNSGNNEECTCAKGNEIHARLEEFWFNNPEAFWNSISDVNLIFFFLLSNNIFEFLFIIHKLSYIKKCTRRVLKLHWIAIFRLKQFVEFNLEKYSNAISAIFKNICSLFQPYAHLVSLLSAARSTLSRIFDSKTATGERVATCVDFSRRHLISFWYFFSLSPVFLKVKIKSLRE